MQLLERERALLIDALKAQIAESLSPSPPALARMDRTAA